MWDNEAERLSPALDVEWQPERFPTFAAVITLRGEHDLATAPSIVEALGAVFGDLLVDLTHCAFCDSSVVHALFESRRLHARENQRVELLVPRANASVTRIFSITGIADRFTIHERLDGNDTEESAATLPLQPSHPMRGSEARN